MANDDGGDILMFMTPVAAATAIEAESLSEIESPPGKLMEGFAVGKYFEVENFTFAMNLADDEASGLEYKDTRPFSRWRGLKASEPKPDPTFKADPETVSLTRLIDASSPLLLSYCLETKKFARVVLVKRARMGESGTLTVVLRMEFQEVWITDIRWEDNDTVREHLDFKFSSVKVNYISRKPDGTVDKEWPCEWKGTFNAG